MSIENDNNEFPPGENSTLTGSAGTDAPLTRDKPAVAAAPGKFLFILLFAGIIIAIIMRSLLGGEKPPEKPIVKHTPEPVVSSTRKEETEFSPGIGGLPVMPPEIAAVSPPPPPPPPPPPINTLPVPETHINAPTNEALNRRIHSGMFVVSGSKTGTQAEQEQKKRSAVISSNDPNSAFAQNATTQGHAAEVATRVRNLGNTIIQGKLIHAVLETAIDSDLPGPLRAITSHDTYAEAGKGILIPKGSRLIGAYNSSIKRGQMRVFIIWERVIRPDGVDVLIDSPGIDSLGRAGMAGDVDNKYFEVFTTAILTSSLDIGVAAIGDALFGNQQTTTVSNGSGTTTSESPTAAAMQQAVTNIGNIGNNIVNNVLNLSPTIYVDQGTPIDVFVNKDLIFPPDVTGSTSFIP